MEDVVSPPITSGLPVAGPWITDVEVEAVLEAVRHGWYEHAGHHVAQFEEDFAAHCRRRHAQALPSCTSGIHLALAALNVGPGDEVIVPESTWIATVAPVCQVGATPVFVDVDPVTWCIDVDRVMAAVTSRTVAVIAVDLYGGMGELAVLETLCRRLGIALVEDAAEAIGSRRDARPAGNFGVASVFSFHGSKTMTCGEGGMIVTDDAELAARMRFLADHGRSPGDVSFRNSEVAFKYKMSSLQAALGRAQLSRLGELVEAKRRIFSWYSERLGAHHALRLNAEPRGVHNSYWMSTAVVDLYNITTASVMGHLEARSINTRPFFAPLSSLPAFAHHRAARTGADRPVAAALARSGVNLPSALSLTESDVDRVCAALLQLLDG